MELDISTVVLLADGFEEIEAITVIDILRRAGIEVILLSISLSRRVTGAHKISIEADMIIEDYNDVPDAVILPGGTPGAENLAASEAVINLVMQCQEQNKLIAAICAAPAYVLAPKGVLAGKRATCYPGFERSFGAEAQYEDTDVVVDGNIITAAGPGAAAHFGVEILTYLAGPDKAAIIKSRALIK